jgi:aspartyl/glutamyl-tRNA(Asn/Gln) amidotransferase C subunit
MVNITPVAKSARIFISPEEKVLYQENIDRMLSWFNDIYITNSECFVYSVVSETLERNYFSDEIDKKESISEVLSNAPKSKENFILVPKVI